MSFNLSIPLSSGILRGFYIEPNNSRIIEDIADDYKLIGYNPSGYRNNKNIIERFCVNTIDLSIPIHKGALVSADLILNLSSGINNPTQTSPSQPIFDPNVNLNMSIDALETDFRKSLVSDFGSSTNIHMAFCAQSGTYFRANNFSAIRDYKKTNLSITTVNLGPQVSVPVTQHLLSHINSSSWQKNNRIILILSGVRSGLGAGGVINIGNEFALNPSLLNLVYDPVPPFEPQSLVISETAYKQVSLNWDYPTDDGGASVTEYTIQYGPVSGEAIYSTNWLVAGVTNSTYFAIDNLELDQTYIFRVGGKNSAGQGRYTAPSIPITISRSGAPVTPLSYNDNNYTRIRVRRDTFSQWTGINPTLAIGEIGYELDTNKMKVGNGIDSWNSLSYITIDESSIDFPTPPDTRLIIGSSSTNIPNNDRIIVNLTDGDRLNIVGEEGVTIDYSNSYKRLSIKTDKLYNPISSGTIFNPTSSGTPGSLLYDNHWLYFCVQNNYWQRSPLDKNWFDFSLLSISNNSGSYPSNTSIIFDKNKFAISTDGDPYPALAGRPLNNNGTSARVGFKDGATIVDQNYIFRLDYRGGQNTHNPMKITNTGIHGIMNNGVPILSISAGTGILPGFVAAPSGFTYNLSFNSYFFGADDCGGYVNVDGSYKYTDGKFLKNCWETDKLIKSNSYYSGTHYNNDYFRHSNGHSKILGFCTDGYPIYGPYAYSGSMDTNSIIIKMRPSYSGIQDDTHRPINWKYWNTMVVGDILYSLPMGLFIEDYVYISGYGDLDNFNGRFAITPEYPSGTYAYYLTFADNNLSIPAFPYIFGTGTKQQRISYSV